MFNDNKINKTNDMKICFIILFILLSLYITNNILTLKQMNLESINGNSVYEFHNILNLVH